MLLPLEDVLPRIAFLWGRGSSWTVHGMLLFLVCVDALLAGQLPGLGMYSRLAASQGEGGRPGCWMLSTHPFLRAGNAEVFFHLPSFQDLLIP